MENVEVSSAASSLRASLLSILNHAVGPETPFGLTQASVPFQELGVDSVTFLRFLVAVEDDLAIEWTTEDPPAAFESIHALGDYLAAEKLSK